MRRFDRRIVITLSLALNLFLLGALSAGIVTRYGWPPPPPGQGPAILPNPRELKEALSPGDRDLLDETFKAHRAEFRPLIEAMRASREQAVAALTAKPFDPKALQAAFADLLASDEKVTAQAQNVLVELAGKLGDDGREAIAGLMRRRP
ncbi:Uncharacterized membrane protein [Arboricoccus pini]|uniref:Uncharacterized membrane protein n=1 Tax=Arboricoccus pini TaxID=1963835 RepID=A0A212PVZ5_9PROT|nr:periplasmic heavy metal sensor [Arboricoccus pini]SNB51074.1 Uncharacterized membrane protein [Arboricoccus pini]